MKRRILLILIIIMFIAGVGILLYPTISNLIAVYSQDMTITHYDGNMEEMDPELIAAEWEKAREYNKKQAGATFSDPFGEENGNPLAEDYLAVLNIGGVMGYVKIPEIDVYLSIYHGTSDAVIRKGAGHLPGSGLPIGGEGNHCALTSHSALSSAKLFTDLEKLEVGDTFYIYVLDEVLAYEIDQILTVLPGDIKALLPVDGEDYVTLITCTPYGINSHRLLVRGTRVELTEEEAAVAGRSVGGNRLLMIISAAAALAALLIVILIRRRRRKNRRHPYVCQRIYNDQARRINEEYIERIEQEKEDDREWLYQLIVAYNRSLFEGGQAGLTDVFSYQQVDFSLIEFGFDEEMIGYLSIPKMEIELPIYLGASKENLKKGAAHLTQTSIPVGGVNTNSVIAAHRGMGTAAMFRNIEKLEIGDEVLITNFRETLTYQVVEVSVIKPTEIDAILIQEGRDMVTLITCHPYRQNYQRYVVYCERAV